MKKSKSLKLHHILSGKIKVSSKVKIKSKSILSQVYTPGVADAVHEIFQEKEKIYDLTIKKNTVAVITDGSAVLGLGNIGSEAALPVMEGKCALFTEFAGLNAFPICIRSQNTKKIIETVKNISSNFAAINLEDIAAPKCFEIEEKLQDLGIPVMHDDQHATAIIVLAGLLNATKVVGKNFKKCKIVINGVGAAGNAIIKLLFNYGCRNIIAVDSRGIINSKRSDLSPDKKEINKITNIESISGSLKNAASKSDILIGVSSKGLFTKEIIKSMNTNPIVFALANPDPEISQKDAISAGAYIYASGRSDDKNQINNALVFPGFFKGLIDNKITKINFKMKVKVAEAIASLILRPTKGRFIPDIFNKKLVDVIAGSLRS